jgi:plasmid stability protein
VIAYPLRNIPDDLWHAVKVRALSEKISVRDVIVAALQRYAAGDFDVDASTPSAAPARKRGRPAAALAAAR